MVPYQCRDSVYQRDEFQRVLNSGIPSFFQSALFIFIRIQPIIIKSNSTSRCKSAFPSINDFSSSHFLLSLRNSDIVHDLGRQYKTPHLAPECPFCTLRLLSILNAEYVGLGPSTRLCLLSRTGGLQRSGQCAAILPGRKVTSQWR